MTKYCYFFILFDFYRFIKLWKTVICLNLKSGIIKFGIIFQIKLRIAYNCFTTLKSVEGKFFIPVANLQRKNYT